jgi:hypothetical protein
MQRWTPTERRKPKEAIADYDLEKMLVKMQAMQDVDAAHE